MKIIRFIHVGLGNYSIQRLEILKKNKNFQLVGLVDIDNNKIKSLSAEHKKIFFSSISIAQKKLGQMRRLFMFQLINMPNWLKKV